MRSILGGDANRAGKRCQYSRGREIVFELSESGAEQRAEVDLVLVFKFVFGGGKLESDPNP